MAKEEVKKEVKEKKPKAKATKNNELSAKIIGVMQGLLANGIVEVNSSVMKDKLKTKNRAVIRRAMKELAKEGKILIKEEAHGKRKRYLYRLA